MLAIPPGIPILLPCMPRFRPDSLKSRAEFGIDLASRITGYPEHTLRADFDKRLLQGCRRTPGGKRLISREGLVSYLKAKGWDSEAISRIERRGAERIWSRKPKKVRLEILDPRLQEPLGVGEGTLVDLSLTGFQARKLSWKGYLPAPGGLVRFEVLGGELKGARGSALLSWVVCKGEDFKMGFVIESLEGRGTPSRWKAFIGEGIESKRRVAATALLEGSAAESN